MLIVVVVTLHSIHFRLSAFCTSFKSCYGGNIKIGIISISILNYSFRLKPSTSSWCQCSAYAFSWSLYLSQRSTRKRNGSVHIWKIQVFATRGLRTTWNRIQTNWFAEPPIRTPKFKFYRALYKSIRKGHAPKRVNYIISYDSYDNYWKCVKVSDIFRQAGKSHLKTEFVKQMNKSLDYVEARVQNNLSFKKSWSP